MLLTLIVLQSQTVASLPALPPGVSVGNTIPVHVRITHALQAPEGLAAKSTLVVSTFPEPTPWSAEPQNIVWSPKGGKVSRGKLVNPSYQCQPVPIRLMTWSGALESAPSTVTLEYDIVTARRAFQARNYLGLNVNSLKELSEELKTEVAEAGKTVPAEIAELAKAQIGKDSRLVVFLDAASRFCGEQVSRGILDEEGKHLGRYDIVRTFHLRRGWCGTQSSLFRAFCLAVGIPAREASGYALKRIGLVDGEVNMNDQRGLPDPRKDGNAHVWAEVFLPKVGWIEINVATRGDCFDVPETFIRVSGQEGGYVNYLDEKGKRLSTDPFAPHITVLPR